MLSFPLLLTIYAGFTHAFETDHLLAVSNIISQRNSTFKSLKDGVFWGLGHTSTILLVGVVMLLLKVQVNPAYFHYLEAVVGAMLIGLGIYRLFKLKNFLSGDTVSKHTHVHPHKMVAAASMVTGVKKLHLVSYSVGLVHGLAGSGELVLLVMLQMAGPQSGLLYLLIFGIGSILGMLVAAAMFSLPFSKKILQAKVLQVTFILMSSVLCIGFGTNIIYKNLFV
jgi:Cytochrome C biogenesis protein transmembrane region